MAQRVFTESLYRYGDGRFGTALAQTRNGVEELIQPVALWELDDATGLYLPPGLSTAPRRPRVDAQLSGSKARIASAPVVGVKTVTSTAAEIFAGASRKSGRSVMMIRNRSASIRIRVGPSTVTDTTGFGIEPEAVLALAFDPSADVPIYAVSEAGNVEVEVFEA